MNDEVFEQVDKLTKTLKDCINELCLKCGCYEDDWRKLCPCHMCKWSKIKDEIKGR